jgi:hypothetical protein
VKREASVRVGVLQHVGHPVARLAHIQMGTRPNRQTLVNLPFGMARVRQRLDIHVDTVKLAAAPRALDHAARLSAG